MFKYINRLIHSPQSPDHRNISRAEAKTSSMITVKSSPKSQTTMSDFNDEVRLLEFRPSCDRNIQTIIINSSALSSFHFRYDWKQRQEIDLLRNNCTGPHRPGYVPMIWGLRRMDKPINITSTGKYLLGFNEPDHVDQAHLTAAVAAQHWKTDIEPHGHGKILVSPAVTNLNWLTDFFHHCKHCRVDHIAIHKYSCHAAEVMNMINEAWRRFHRPIWLTEFSCPHSTDPKEQLIFMKDILPRLEASPHVFRYAWFVTRALTSGWVTPAASLLNHDDSTLTPLGQYYNNFRE